MAGGIDWFRWHHGSVTDPKFQLVARRSGASVAAVIAVWATLLEAASMAAQRGDAGVPDCEALDCALGLSDGQTKAIFDAMLSRDLVTADGGIVSWEKRQPKREREDHSAADRKRAQREREAADQRQSEPQSATDAHVTPRHATSHQSTPRGEERREEKREDKAPPKPPRRRGGASPTFDPSAVELPDWLDRELWQRWCRDRAERKKPITEEGARAQLKRLAEYRDGGHTPEAVLTHAMAGGNQGLFPPPAVRPPAPAARASPWVQSNTNTAAALTGRTPPKEVLDV